MTDDLRDLPIAPEGGEATESAEAPPPVKAPAIESRFLFVDVAAQRAKQLRRGARPRLAAGSEIPHKLERLAMREVHACLVEWELPAAKPATGPEAQP
jgi:DNA-directed RNA polymerase omega subunit